MIVRWSRLAFALASFGCNAREGCWTDPTTVHGRGDNVASESVSNELRLSADDLRARVELRATLSGLPELWQDDPNLTHSAAVTSVRLAYEQAPLGYDGITQMPRVSVSLRVVGAARQGLATSSAFPGPAALTAKTEDIFPLCEAGQTAGSCCEYGATECVAELTLAVERLDAAPFPPVTVTLSTESTARVSGCPVERDTAAQIELEQVSP